MGRVRFHMESLLINQPDGAGSQAEAEFQTMSDIGSPGKPRLPDQVRDAVRVRRHSIRTEEG